MADRDSADFGDLDQPQVFHEIKNALENLNTFNFAVKFDSTRAQGLLNFKACQLDGFFGNDAQQASCARWIHISGPERQVECIKKIAARYDLSPRLLKIIVTPRPPIPHSPESRSSHVLRRSHVSPVKERHSPTKPSFQMKSQSASSDLEKASQGQVENSNKDERDMLNHYNIVKRVWHFWSTDWSEKCLCIGYNALSNLTVDIPPETNSYKGSRKHRQEDHSAGSQPEGDIEDRQKDKPAARRLWTWLLICEDGTVISLQETPFPTNESTLNAWQQEAVKTSRKTFINVFKHLSKVGDNTSDLAIDTLEIRPGCFSHSSRKVTIVDSQGLLFYYLFDDWYTTFDLIANDKCRYTKMLDDLRETMFQRADFSKIDQLHHAGQQLAVLKRIYESYVLIIDRILCRQKTLPSTDNSVNPKFSPESTLPPQPHMGSEALGQLSEEGGQAFLVPLTPKSTVRFERLRDRIKMYALNEIEQCLEEKESLVFLNFNLMTMRQSNAVEKLTRITILLAKVTIMFMPVSVMTGYFSTQIKDLQDIYTAKTYWVCFAVTIFISFLFLVGFGVISHTLEGGVVYQSLTDATFKLPRRALVALQGKRNKGRE